MDLSFLPSPDKIPVHWLWFHILLLVTFLVHVILMNLIVGGSLLTLWDYLSRKKIRKDSGSIPTLIALTINFGVPPLLFVQVLYGHLFYTSSILMAVPWILVIPVLILAYYGAYIFAYQYEKKKKLALISLMVSTLFLLTIAFVYVNNITLSMSPERFVKYFENSKGWNLHLEEASIIPRYLHYIVASIAIAGLGRAAYYHFSGSKEKNDRAEGRTNGLKIFAYATMIQILVGVLFWFTLPRDIARLLIGGNWIFSLLFGTGIILAFLIIMMAVRERFMATLILIIPLLSIMILIRDFVRRSYLSDAFTPVQLENTSQPGSLVLFLIVFAIGLASLWYMIRLMIHKPKTTAP
ncbi:MAG: hypothetical protein IH594_16725 [Bacteroidales bacterium]|nr:hypothetical protein [Bacteroidales bacterium]